MTKQKWMMVMGVLLLGAASCSKGDSTADPGKNDQTVRPVTGSSSAYVDTVFDFMPAPGQFINTSFADITTVRKITQNETISLGAWGGRIVLGFDHTVLNNAGDDLLIKGNGTAISAEPGIVWVSYDANGNGKPDDAWYELKGSEYGASGYERNYQVTYYKPASDKDNIMWVDNHKDTGYIRINSVHTQAYYPSWITEDHYTLEGSLLPSTGIDTGNASYITSASFKYGYADNRPVAEGGDSLDISNAIDANGNAVNLTGIDFYKNTDWYHERPGCVGGAVH